VLHKLLTKKRALVLGAVAVLAVAGAAFAYWTTTGSGTGTGKAAASNGTLVLHGTITEELTPGKTSPVTFTADNAGSSSLRVEAVKAVVTNSKEPGCKSADFTIADTTENQTIAAKSSEVPLGKDGSITMADTGVNQDECKSAVVTLTLSSN
jgi:hypothetical protein